jgi:hypothetical protein
MARVAEIDWKVRAVLDTKQEQDLDLQIRFVHAQGGGWDLTQGWVAR